MFGIHWNDYLLAFFAGVTAMSCFLYINAMPRGFARIADKLLAYFLGAGAFGVMVGPFFDIWNDPTIFEMAFAGGTAAFSFSLTREHWCVEIEQAAAVVREEEEHKCSR
jgi:hypothetical protein